MSGSAEDAGKSLENRSGDVEDCQVHGHGILEEMSPHAEVPEITENITVW